MKSFSKYALPLVAALSSTLGFSNLAFAQYSHETNMLLNEMDQIVIEFEQFTAIVERQAALRGPCDNGDQNACAEIEYLDRQIEMMMENN